MTDTVRTRVERFGEKLSQAAADNPELFAKLKVFAAIGLLIVAMIAIPAMFREVPEEPQVAARPVIDPIGPAPSAQAPEPPRRHPLAAVPADEAVTPGASPRQHPMAARSETDDDEASLVVEAFFKALGQAQFEGAYRQLSPEWQKSLDYGTFARGYAGTEAIRCQVDHARKLSPDLARVAVTLDVVQDGRTAQYVASYLVLKTPDGWRLDRGLQLQVY